MTFQFEFVLVIIGLQLSEYNGHFTVGQSANITCSYDLAFTSIEWLHGNATIMSSTTSQLDLSFNPVNDSIHGNQYICRVTTPYGIKEERLTIQIGGTVATNILHGITGNTVLFLFFLVPATAIMMSINSVSPSVAGYNYTLTCTVTLTEGILGTPTIWWTNADGQQISSSGDIILHDSMTSGLTTNLTLYFDPIRTTDEGIYNCVASVSSPSLATPLNSSTTYFISVRLSKCYLFVLVAHFYSINVSSFAAYPITVMIVDTSYPDRGTEYIPGSSVQLHCLADSRFAPVVTTWNSTCNGNCFVLQQTFQEVIMTDVLHSTDSGNHSCMVVDDVGNTGHATIEMHIVGEHNRYNNVIYLLLRKEILSSCDSNQSFTKINRYF